MHDPGFKGMVALITGAASGFGALLAQRLAGQGVRLVLGDVNESALEDVVGRLRASGAEVVGQRCDVSREADARQLVEAGVQAWGRLDIAVNNAGVSTVLKRLVDVEEAEFDLVYAVNAKGVFFGMKHQIPAMVRQGGGIILNVASMAGLGAAPKLSAYAASKHAVVGLTKTAAVEYARGGVRVNAVCPFYTNTPMVEGTDIGENEALFSQGTPMKRYGKPEEIVEVMMMLCSPANTYMTGQALAVDGGVSAL